MSQIHLQFLFILVLQSCSLLVISVNYMRGPIIPSRNSLKTSHIQNHRKRLFFSNNHQSHRGNRNEPVVFRENHSDGASTTEASKLTEVSHISGRRNQKAAQKKQLSSSINSGQGLFGGLVLNDPVGGRRNHKSVPMLQESLNAHKTRSTESITSPTRSTSTPSTSTLMSLLDFHVSTTEEEPLFDFPNPLPPKPKFENRLQQYNEFCQVQVKQRKSDLNKAKPPSKIKNSPRQNEIKLQDRHLTEHSINYFMYGETFKGESIMFSLLNKTGEIFKAICPNQYAPEYKVDLVINLFQSLYTKTNPSRAQYLDENSFEWIESILDKCWAESKNVDFEFEVDKCSGQILGTNDGTFICTPREEDINFSQTDPFLDLIWHIYNAVASRCFECFHENYRMFHKYSMLIMDLFTNPLQLRWKHNTSELHKDVKSFWGFLFGPNHSAFFHNIERCTEFSLMNHKGVHIQRSPRFFYMDSIRFNSLKNPL